MDFIRILNAFFAVVAWIIILLIVWAVAPYAVHMWHFVQSVHDWGK